MSQRRGEEAGLARAHRRLERWRAQHGGPGRAVPDELWAEAIEVARTEGVEATARALRLDRRRLARRMPIEEPGVEHEPEVVGAFVEVAGSALCPPGRTVLSLEGADGERMCIEVSGAPTVDVVGLAQAFWRRGR